MASNTHIYPIVHWKEYLDPTNGKRVKRFLKSNGSRVFNNLIRKIKEADEIGDKTLVILVHPNVSSLSLIKAEEYISVLEHCLLYFKHTEDYLKCAEIVKLKNKIGNKKKK